MIGDRIKRLELINKDLMRTIDCLSKQIVLKAEGIGVEFQDVTAPEHLQIEIREDGKVVWINIDGICRFRACRIKHLEVIDNYTNHTTEQWLPSASDMEESF